MKKCDCLNFCGDDPWLQDGRAAPCDKLKARIEAEKVEREKVTCWDCRFARTCWDYRFASDPEPLAGAATGEVMVCSLGAQFMAAKLRRTCSTFEVRQ